MRTHHLLLFTILFFASTFSYLHPASATGEQPPTTGNNGDTEFIRSSCNTTLYPDICYTSLSRYANAVQQNPGQLARVAISVSLSKVHRIASYISNLTHEADYGASSRAVLALHDCFSNLDDAVSEIRGSLKQMRQLGAAGSGTDSFLFQMSNVQTWMSAALTDEETCTDGFQDVPECPMKSDVYNRVTRVKKFTSNALALVNSYANKGPLNLITFFFLPISE
ncbi:pectinesterase inhibitor 7 [Cicer arietinum]|uniref:Pectinesterase inhibitor 7 n=1 Tax=Cicer arietinum TaxID=3827 RepID=A0A1S2YF53_CICAR|nr:pectinesterase inhibitor 7 [Cicer arietinum]